MNNLDKNLLCQKDRVCWHNYYVLVSLSEMLRKRVSNIDRDILNQALHLERMLREFVMFPPKDTSKKKFNLTKYRSEKRDLLLKKCKDCDWVEKFSAFPIEKIVEDFCW